MVGVQVGVHRLDQFEIELLDELQVAIHFFQHGIDDHRFPAAAAGEEVGVGARHGLEQLPEDHFFGRLGSIWRKSSRNPEAMTNILPSWRGMRRLEPLMFVQSLGGYRDVSYYDIYF